MDNIKFAIDLTWVRHKIVGGSESFALNLIGGFLMSKKDFIMTMIVARDNAWLFEKFVGDKRVIRIVAPMDSKNVKGRIMWQNILLSSLLRRNGIDVCLEPIYAKPFFASRRIKWVTVIHDLQALHLPQFFSFFLKRWLKASWQNSVSTSSHIVAISDFVRNDIIKRYGIEERKITTIYNPITLENSELADFADVSNMYGIDERGYYYTVAKLNAHKNLLTLIKVFGEIKHRGISTIPCKLVISGMRGGMDFDMMSRIVNEYDLKDNLVFTGYVENKVRNSLYRHARAFLFPSIFEGFGMPLIEAILADIPIVSTNLTCMPEVTQGMAYYVDDPYSVDEWIDKIIEAEKGCCYSSFDMGRYSPSLVADKYLDVIGRVSV